MTFEYSSRTILEKYLKPAVSVAEGDKSTSKKSIERQNQTQFHLAHYADGLFRSYEERLSSTEWQAAMHLRRQKVYNVRERKGGELFHINMIVDCAENGVGSTY